jgi:catechol 2,3-dioxygenase-like lactoylglutathione lyase family enzyme
MKMRIHHVSIPRPPGSAAAARAFYGKLLGLEELPHAGGETEEESLWFAAGATEIHLLVEEPMGQDRSARHFCLAVEDIEALRVRLEAAGVAVVGAAPMPGRPRYFIRDPFGNLIEIAALDDPPATA